MPLSRMSNVLRRSSAENRRFLSPRSICLRLFSVAKIGQKSTQPSNADCIGSQVSSKATGRFGPYPLGSPASPAYALWRSLRTGTCREKALTANDYREERNIFVSVRNQTVLWPFWRLRSDQYRATYLPRSEFQPRTITPSRR